MQSLVSAAQYAAMGQPLAPMRFSRTVSHTTTVSPAGTLKFEHQESTDHEYETATANPSKGKSTASRLRSKLRAIPSSTRKISTAVRSASQKVSRATNKTKNLPSRLRAHCKSLCSSKPAADGDDSTSSEAELQANPTIGQPSTSSGIENSETNPVHGPGVTPSPYPDTATSMEVCEWAMSAEIANHMAWICSQYAGGNKELDIPRRASCLNRAILHLYPVDEADNISMPAGATGLKDHYLISSSRKLYPRGAMGLKKPNDPEFPSWRHSPDRLVPIQPHEHGRLRGVFFPKPSRLSQVESTCDANNDSNITGRSLRREKTMGSRRALQQKTIAVSKEEDGLDTIEEEDKDLPDQPVAAIEQLVITDADESDNSLSVYSNEEEAVYSDSEEVDGEPSIIVHRDIDFSRPVVAPTMAPLLRSAGFYNLNRLPNVIVEEEQEEEEEEEELDENHGIKCGSLEESDAISGSELYFNDSASLEALSEVDVETLHESATQSGKEPSIEPLDELKPEQSEHIQPDPKESELEGVKLHVPGTVDNGIGAFSFQTGKIFFPPRPGCSPQQDSASEYSENGDVEETIQLEDVKENRGDILHFDSSKFLEACASWMDLSNPPTGTQAQDDILICQYDTHQKSECDADAFSITSPGPLRNFSTAAQDVITIHQYDADQLSECDADDFSIGSEESSSQEANEAVDYKADLGFFNFAKAFCVDGGVL